MSHKEILRQLFPVELGGVFDKDIELEGRRLDDALSRAGSLQAQIFPDTADELLSGWERLCGITPGGDDTLLIRRARVVAHLRATGRLDRQYFIDLAADLGCRITIHELASGEDGYGPEGIFVWRVTIWDATTETIYFQAGESIAGDYLMTWRSPIDIEGWFNELKPAHTLCLYAHDITWPLVWPFDGSLLEEALGYEPVPGYLAALKDDGHAGGCVAFQPAAENLMANPALFSSALDFSNWMKSTGVTVTVTQGQEDPDGGSGGTRIQTTGGTDTAKYFSNWLSIPAGEPRTSSVWVKCLSGSLVFGHEPGILTVVHPADGWVRLTRERIGGAGVININIFFRTELAADALDFLAYHPQIEANLCATDFTATSRGQSVLEYAPGREIPQQGTIRVRLKFLLAAASFPTMQTIIDWSDDAYSFRLYTTADDLMATISSGAGKLTTCLLAGLSYAKDTWYPVALTWDYATGMAALYADGRTATSDVDHTADEPPEISTLMLGAQKNGDYPLHGSMDDLQIERVVRTQAELSEWLGW